MTTTTAFEPSPAAVLPRRRPSEAPFHFGGGSVEVHLQPKVRLRDMVVSGYECLARLRLADGALVSPGRFLPAMKEQGVIDRLTEFMVSRAVEHSCLFGGDGFEREFAVNIPAGMISREGGIARLERLIVDSGLGSITAEISEETGIGSTAGINIRRLAESGFRVSLDDFGAGATSLAHVMEMDLHEVKIDRGLFARSARSPRGRTLLENLVAGIRKVGMTVVAEGVETEDDLELARALGCDHVQGFLLGRPFPDDSLRSVS